MSNKVLLNYSKNQSVSTVDPHCNVLRIDNMGKPVSCATVMLDPLEVIAKIEAARIALKSIQNVSFIVLDFNTIVLSVQDRKRNAGNLAVFMPELFSNDDTDHTVDCQETMATFAEFMV